MGSVWARVWDGLSRESVCVYSSECGLAADVCDLCACVCGASKLDGTGVRDDDRGGLRGVGLAATSLELSVTQTGSPPAYATL